MSLEQSKSLKRRMLRDSLEIARLKQQTKDLQSEHAKQSLHLAGAIMLLKRCKDRVDARDPLFVDIRKFLVQELNAE